MEATMKRRNDRITVDTFARTGRTTLLDAVRSRTTLPLDVVPVGHGHVATDPTHLRFNATYRTDLEARAAAFVAMARRVRV
jgi:hypothetical protein